MIGNLFTPDFKADFNLDDTRLVKPAQLQLFANWLAGAPDVFIDWETNGTNVRKGARPFMLGAYSPKQGAKIVDFRLCGDHGVEAVRDGLRKRGPGQRTRSFNFGFEYKMGRALGVDIGGDPWDSMLAAFAVNELRENYGEFGAFSQKALVWHELKKDPMWAKTVKAWQMANLGHTDGGFELIPASIMVPYNAEDLELGWELSEHLRKQVNIAGLDTLVAVDSLCAVEVALIEERGIAFDEQHARSLQAQYSEGMQREYKRILNALHTPFDPNSPQKLFGLLYGQFGLPMHEDQEKAGKVDDGVLEWMMTLPQVLEDPRKAEAIDAIRNWKEFHKLKDTYLMPWLYEWQEKGILYPNLFMMGAETRRFSARNPNLQNVPGRTDLGAAVRACLTSRLGWCTYSMDESQAEYRAFAHYSRASMLIEGYTKGGRAFDIHELVSAMLGVKRKVGKNLNFGCLYGMGLDKLARELLRSKPEAKLLLDQYHARLPEIKALRKDLEQQIRRLGYVRDVFGGRRHLKVEHAFKALNTICQMTVADLMRHAMVKAGPMIRAAGGNMLLQVHDEIAFELPGDDCRAHLPVLREIRAHAMEGFREFSVPFYSDCEQWSPNFSNMVKLDLEAA